MDKTDYMLRGHGTHLWHLPSTTAQTGWTTLCTMPLRGKEERLLAPDQPQPHDTLCPKCQQIKRARERVQVLAVEAALVKASD